MSKILIYDDEETIVKQLKSGIRALDLELKPIVFTELEILKKYIYSEENWEDVKALVFDLAQKKEEDEGITDFEILVDIKWCYENRRVPIIIHSAFAHKLEILKKYPSVFLFKKGAHSVRSVRDTIAILEKSGFLDLFCEGPLLKDEVKQLKLNLEWGDDLLKSQLLNSFIDNFINRDIIQDLSEIIDNNDDKNIKRITFSKFLSPAIESLKKLE